MNDAWINVLLVEDDPADARLIQQALAGTEVRPFRVEWVTGLASALERLGSGGIEVVLLDLTLSGSQGIGTFERVFRAMPNALIVVLTTAGEEETARRAVQGGAHDHFVKSHVDAHWLPRVLVYMVDRKTTENALRKSEARFRAMSDASPLGILVSDAQGSPVYSNAAYQKISGMTFEQTLCANWSRAIHPDDRQRVLAEWREAVLRQAPFQSEARFLRDDGSVVWARLNSATMPDATASHSRVHTVEDITARKTTEFVLRVAEEALFAEKERAQVTLNSIGDAVLTTDLLYNVTYLNQVAEAMTGWSREDALGRPLAEVFHIIDGTTGQPVVDTAQRAIT